MHYYFFILQLFPMRHIKQFANSQQFDLLFMCRFSFCHLSVLKTPYVTSKLLNCWGFLDVGIKTDMGV